MLIRLDELRAIFEPEARGPKIASCSRLINEFLGEALFLALFTECLELHSGGKWSYSQGEAWAAKENNRRINQKRLDGFVHGHDHGSMIPSLLACEVKGWCDNSLGGYRELKRLPKGSEAKRTRGAFYWKTFPAGFRRNPGAKEGPFCKLDVLWDPPIVSSAEVESGVGLLMYHLISPPEGEERVSWPFSETRSLFWYSPEEFTIHKRVLVFSVAQYLRERSSNELEFNDENVNFKLEALRRLGVV